MTLPQTIPDHVGRGPADRPPVAGLPAARSAFVS